MAHYTAKEELISRLTIEDRAALKSIYCHRCLNRPLMEKVYAQNSASEVDVNARIGFFVETGLIEEVDYGKEFPALFLTTYGVVTVRHLLKGTNELPKSTLTASDLKINVKSINHQIHLNQFAIEFDRYAKGYVDYAYYDEKFMPPASNFMMPDGMIELPDCFLFLEMDMGNERTPALNRKWESYRGFLTFPKEPYRNKPIIMLFIIDGVTRVEQRKNTVIASICSRMIDQATFKFDVCIDTANALHTYIQNNILRMKSSQQTGQEAPQCLKYLQKHGFTMSKTAFLSGLDSTFELYARRLNKQKRIIVENDRAQEFLVDTWFDGRLSVLRKILHYTRLVAEMKKSVKRALPYIVIVPTEKWVYNILRVAKVDLAEDIYFTTLNRLQKYPWEKAVFSFDKLGNMVHYMDSSLKAAVHERVLA